VDGAIAIGGLRKSYAEGATHLCEVGGCRSGLAGPSRAGPGLAGPGSVVCQCEVSEVTHECKVLPGRSVRSFLVQEVRAVQKSLPPIIKTGHAQRQRPTRPLGAF
jgi:hypothetical protein